MNVRACRTCGHYITLVRLFDGSGWIPVNPDPVPQHLQDANTCVAVDAGFAWPIADLVKDVAVVREVSETEAQHIARDEFVWHTRHRCEAAA